MLNRRLRSALLKSCLAAGSVMVTLLASEAGLHLVTGRRYLDKDLRLLTGDIAWVPNQKARWTHVEWDTVYEINSDGFRDVEPASHQGRPGLVALGDSFTEGYGVDLDKSYSKLLERGMEQAGYRYHVYNAGLQGRSPKDYIRIYDHYFKDRKNITMVTMGFVDGNDIITPETGAVTPPNRQNPSYWMKRFLCENSVIYNLIRRPIRTSPKIEFFLHKHRLSGNIAPTAVWADFKWASPDLFKSDWDYTLSLIQEFHRNLQKQGRQFVLISIPFKEQVDDRRYEEMVKISQLDPARFKRTGFKDYMAQFCRNNGIPFLDLTPAFIEANRKNPNAYYFRADGHWNPLGHTLAAEELERFILKNHLLPKK